MHARLLTLTTAMVLAPASLAGMLATQPQTAQPQTAEPQTAEPNARPEPATDPDERARALTIEDLRRENGRLRRRIVQLEEQLLTLSGRPATDAGDPNAEPTAPIPAEATASPASLREALRLAYDERFAPDDRPVLGESSDAYRREVQRWTRTIGRELRGRVEWLARIELVALDPDARRSEARRRRVVLSVLDPATLHVIDEPVVVDVPSQYVARVADADADQLWVLTGQVEATPSYDAGRTESGPFNFPAFIGPYAAFGFDLRWTNLAEISPERAREGLVSPSDQRGPVDR